MSIFHLQALEFLQISAVYQTTPFKNWNLPKSSCNIRSLQLDHVFMDITAVTDIISSLKALTELKYYCDISLWQALSREENPLSQWSAHSWSQLGKSLQQHRDTLERLDISCLMDQDILEVVYPDGYDHGILCAFHNFPKLVSVSGPIDAFLDMKSGDDDFSKYFPPQLNYVCFSFESNNDAAMSCYSSAVASIERVLYNPNGMHFRVRLDSALLFEWLRL